MSAGVGASLNFRGRKGEVLIVRGISGAFAGGAHDNKVLAKCERTSELHVC